MNVFNSLGAALWWALCSSFACAGGSWDTMAPMPTSRSEIAAASVGDRIFVPGGVSMRGSLKTFEAYHTKTNTWEKLCPLPTKLNHVGVAACLGKIYISGGFEDVTQKRKSSLIHVYDPAKDSFIDTIEMPDTRAKHSMIERDGWLHLIGGLVHREVWSYQISTGRWSKNKLPALAVERDHLSILQDSKAIYIVGGRKDEQGENPKCLRYRPGLSSRWEKLTTLPLARGGQMAALINGKIHIAGGEDLQTKEVIQRHDIFDLESGCWSTSVPLANPRHGSASICVGGCWYVIGGGSKSHIRTLFSTSRLVDRWR